MNTNNSDSTANSVNNVNFYQFDGCYSRPSTISATNFDICLNSQFYNSLVTTVAECQAEALKKSADFFLMNDISSSTNINSSNCYVPKPLTSNLGSIVSGDIVGRIFSNLFGASPKISVNDTCNNMIFRRLPVNAPESQKCFKYTLDEQVYAPKTKYAYYIKPVLNEANLTTMSNVRSRPTSFYNNPTKLNQLTSYRDLLYINENNIQASGPIYTTFKNFICNPTKENEALFDVQLKALTGKYDVLIDHLDLISADLSNINYLKTDDNNILLALNARIADKNQELANLLGSGGANNGRLSDNVFLTQFKIVENGILLLIMISVCIVYYRSRNITSLIPTK